jgi:hypothetical protein
MPSVRSTVITPPPQRLLVKILTRDVTRCLDDTHIFLTSDRIKAPEMSVLRFRHALLVWQSRCFIRDRHERPATFARSQNAIPKDCDTSTEGGGYRFGGNISCQCDSRWITGQVIVAAGRRRMWALVRETRVADRQQLSSAFAEVVMRANEPPDRLRSNGGY